MLCEPRTGDGVPKQLRRFRAADWPAVDDPADPLLAELAAAGRWRAARGAYVDALGYPAGDVLGWLRSGLQVRHEVRARHR